MPQTRQNGGIVPVGSDPYALTQDLAIHNDSLNVVIPVANAAARDALTAVNGMLVIRLDQGGLIQQYIDGAWRDNYKAPYRQWLTQTTFTWDTPTTVQTRNITFPSGRFTAPPQVYPARMSGQLAKTTLYSYDITTVGCTVGMISTDGTAQQGTCPVGLNIVQATPTSGFEPIV